jgi:hypothetical protein
MSEDKKNKNFNHNTFPNRSVKNNSIPNRSILVPLITLLYINNLLKTIHRKPKSILIADDASITSSNSTLDDFKMI